jgi:hypothetical protein
MAEQFLLLSYRQRVDGSFNLMEGVHVERLALPGPDTSSTSVARVNGGCMEIVKLIVSILGFGE